MNTTNKVKQLVLNAMLAAVRFVLAMYSLDFGAVKFTFEGIPVHIASLLFGPASGMAVGGVGTLLYQLLRYGITATTPLWILPYVLCGGVVGLAAKRRRYSLSRLQTVLLIVAGELIITLCNTGALYVDSNLYGWYYPALITGYLALRLFICVAKAVVYGLVLPEVVQILRRVLHLEFAPQKGMGK